LRDSEDDFFDERPWEVQVDCPLGSGSCYLDRDGSCGDEESEHMQDMLRDRRGRERKRSGELS